MKPGVDGRLGHRALLHAIEALLGAQRGHRLAVARDLDQALRGGVVGALDVAHAAEGEHVAGELGGVADRHLHVALDLVGLDHADAERERGHAQVREHHAEHRARQLARARPHAAAHAGADLQMLPKMGGQREHDPAGEQEAERRHGTDVAGSPPRGQRGGHRQRERPAQATRQVRKLRLLQRASGPMPISNSTGVIIGTNTVSK